ncbi:MAG: hypothetical protein KatS3mg111_1260 [Pirellulaceae bacterium]|nr:MAG: hypothetical protein KatS3mg111_1260 [Pirellulaceae bacterium]
MIGRLVLTMSLCISASIHWPSPGCDSADVSGGHRPRGDLSLRKIGECFIDELFLFELMRTGRTRRGACRFHP